MNEIFCLHSSKQQLHNNNCTVHFYAYQHLKWLKHDESVKLEKDMCIRKIKKKTIILDDLKANFWNSRV